MKKKYQIKIKSLHRDSLNLYINFLTKTLQSIKINFSICNLPKKKNRITLLKSPHVNKSAREQFEIKYSSTVIQLNDNINQKILETLLVNKPKSVSVSVKNF
jgi:small subunit ribosomal protein S10